MMLIPCGVFFAPVANQGIPLYDQSVTRSPSAREMPPCQQRSQRGRWAGSICSFLADCRDPLYRGA